MPRICILTSVHSAFDTRIFQKQARSMVQAGYEVVLVAPHTRDEEVEGVRIRAIGRSSNRLVRILSSPARVLRAALRTPADAYHFHDPELLPVGVALGILGRRVVYDVHENVPQDIREKLYLPRLVAPALGRLVGAFQRAVSPAFRLVVAVNEQIAAGFPGHPNVIVVRNFPARAFFEGRPSGGSRTAAPEEALRLAYVGMLTPDRGGEPMVNALDLLPEDAGVRLHMYGRSWPEEFAERLRSLAGFRRVVHHGEVPYAEIPAALAQSDVGLVCFQPIANNVNGGPTKLFEYMASGLPVIASNFPQWRDVVEGNDCGLCVDPTDPGAIASAIQWMAAHPERRAEMGANGRRAVERIYNWEAEASRLLGEYAKMLRS